ncbi:right-handed parallel beta-helix repeat-containing protein [Bacteroidota bacterium]
MKKLLQFILGALVSISLAQTVSAEIITQQGTISTDVTWTDTVHITGNIVVMDDVTLDISAGTLVEFQGYYMLKILGTIKAEGEDLDSIIFTYHDTLGFMDFSTIDGGWKGIWFNNTASYGGANGAMNDNDTSVFSKCRFEFIKIIDDSWGIASPIEVNEFAGLVIKRCEIKDNYTSFSGGAIGIINESDISVRFNNIHHNTGFKNGGAIYIKSSAPGIISNKIKSNKTLTDHPLRGQGGAIYALANNGVIVNNMILENEAHLGAGIAYSDASGKIQKNTIFGNKGYSEPGVESQGGGIYLKNNSAPVIIHNKIANNLADNGGGIYSVVSIPVISNNLIVNNTATIGCGGWQAVNTGGLFINNTVANNAGGTTDGLHLKDSDPGFVNNIIWGSDNMINLVDAFAQIHIQNSIVDSVADGSISGPGSHTSENLSSEYPEFVAVSGGLGIDFNGIAGNRWKIKASSPCVNAGVQDLEDLPIPGNDLAGNKRIEHAIIDIGPYEVHIDTISFQDTIKSDTTWIADTVKIRGDVVVNDGVTLTVLPGTFVDFKGPYRLQVNGTIKAVGEWSTPIVFSKTDTTDFYKFGTKLGGWQGIHFNNGPEGMNNAMSDNDTSVFRFCFFNFAKNPLLDTNGAAMTIKYYDGVNMANCTFRDNVSNDKASGLFIVKSKLTVSNCKFYNNISNFGSTLLVSMSELVLTHSEFRNNRSNANGGAVRFYGTDASVEHNSFINNIAELGGAVYQQHSPTVFRHNLFSNNTATINGGALHISFTGYQLINNVIVNNSAGNKGGAIYMKYASDAVTVNNTICNNLAGITGGAISNDYTTHTAINDIYYGNSSDPIGGTMLGRQYYLYTSQSDVSFENCILEGGSDSILVNIGDSFQGSTDNIIDSLPYFIKPTPGAGTDYDGTKGKWWYKAISPCINAGTSSVYLDSVDIAGKPRIYDSLVDIGAYESQFGLPEITLQPVNQIVCTGDTVTFNINSRYLANFQWQWNGEDIPGATDKWYQIDSVASANDGNYQCVVSNSFGSVLSTPVYLLARSSPEIAEQPEDTWTAEGLTTVIPSSASGTPPLNFQWYKGGVKMNWAHYPNLKFWNTDYNHEGLYHCEISNACGSVNTDTVQLYLAPQICMVTVDTNTNHNLVIWEKESTAPVESFNIYRESIVAGEYDLIGNMASDDLSVYTDTEVNPVAQSYIYKITAMDLNGNESDIGFSKPHRTIHLLSSENTELNTIQLDWTRYFGYDYGTFHIYRGQAGTGLDSVHSIAASSTQWIDTEATPGIDYYYRVLVLKETPCKPTGNLKAGTGPYTHSLSNLDDNKLKQGSSPPDTIMLSNSSIEEGNLAGMAIGKLSTVDKDSLDTHQYQFVTGTGDDDNQSFTLAGELLLATESFDYDTKSQYSIRLRSTDPAGNYFEIDFIIEILKSTTGLDNIATSSMRIFPNPFSEETTIEFPNPVHSEYRMFLRDLSGKIVLSEGEITGDRVLIRKNNLNPGVYFIELRGEKILRGKLVIR